VVDLLQQFRPLAWHHIRRWGLVGAVAGEHIKKMGSRCAREKSEGGWYEPVDLTTPYSPLISEFTGTCDGKPLTIRVVYSPEVDLRGKFKNNEADLAALNPTFHKTADAIVAVLAR
jgi:hypothetical protein